MKKIFTLVCLSSIVFGASSQTQRKVFIEEFTQASCPPCASQNPAFNTLLAANTAKVVSLKYQTSWPGTDPMNLQNPVDVANRVDYYTVTGVPTACMDGVDKGGANAITQTNINAAYAITSPFAMSLTHMLSADFDSVYINLDITASNTVSGNLVLHVAIAEKEIIFTTAPGTNGEKNFYNIMRKMLPDADGTTLASSWTTSQTQNIKFGVPVPSYLYDLRQLNVVAFIQNNTNKKVLQAAGTQPESLAASIGDMSITSLTATTVPAVFCAATQAPKVNLKNVGTVALTSVTFVAEVDGAVAATQQWTGNVAANGTSTFTFTGFAVPSGKHKMAIRGTNVNGGNTDYSLNNNLKDYDFMNHVGIVEQTPYTNDFEGTTWVGQNGFINNVNKDDDTWSRFSGVDGAFGNSARCIGLLFYYITNGKVDEYILPPFDMSTISNPQLTFNVAYARYDFTSNDKLEVKVSSNCGSTWTTVYNKAGAALVTLAADTTTSVFAPAADDWRAETVSLASYGGQGQVIVKFVGTSNYGNDVWLDDINIAGSLGLPNQTVKLNDRIFPNPATNEVAVEFNNSKTQDVFVTVKNTVGALVSETKVTSLTEGNQKLKINTSEFPTGIYFVELKRGDEKTVHKLNISK